VRGVTTAEWRPQNLSLGVEEFVRTHPPEKTYLSMILSWRQHPGKLKANNTLEIR